MAGNLADVDAVLGTVIGGRLPASALIVVKVAERVQDAGGHAASH